MLDHGISTIRSLKRPNTTIVHTEDHDSKRTAVLIVIHLGHYLCDDSHIWQSRVEIEHYSVAYFTRITVFEAL